MSTKDFIEHDEKNKSPLDLYYNAWFNSKTDCSLLDKKFNQCMSKFPIILASSEISVYKICHHFYSQFNLQIKDIKTIDGLAIESYFDPYANHKYNIIQMNTVFNEGVLSDICGKWLVIPNMKSQWTPRLAYLFYNELRNAGALGLIFYSEGSNTFGKILVEETLLDILQFPVIRYKAGRKIKNDNY